MSEKYTIRRSQAGKNIDEFVLPSCDIREIKKMTLNFEIFFNSC